MLLGRHIFDAFANGSGFFQHGHTYMGRPMAAAALAVQDEAAEIAKAYKRGKGPLIIADYADNSGAVPMAIRESAERAA